MRTYFPATATLAAALPALLLCGTALAAGTADPGAQTRVTPVGTIITPYSSVQRPEDAGLRAHTNVKIFVPRGRRLGAAAPSGNYETPASLACVYHVVPVVAGCNPTSVTTVPSGGAKMIAIVDAFDDPNAASDLAVFSKQFKLPAITSSNFAVVYASGTQPIVDTTGGWELEESLDVQMAHAMAPNAKVVLVEAASNNNTDLLKAELVAKKMVAAAGGGEVSNSWASGEYSTEAKEADFFTEKKVVVFASAGDAPGVVVPSGLPNVVSVGGTSINRSSNGNFVSQTTWNIGGGGISAYIPLPTFQSAVTSVVGTHRGTPDIAADANPQTGPWIYDTTPYQGQTLDWLVIGGTSVAAPLMAGIVNASASFNASTTAELTQIYANLGNTKAFADVTKGACKNAFSGTASVGYDLCTGVGVPAGTVGQ